MGETGDRGVANAPAQAPADRGVAASVPGKASAAAELPDGSNQSSAGGSIFDAGGPSVQRKSHAQPDLEGRRPADVAQGGFVGAGDRLPFAHQIQQSFGRHDISGTRAFVGGAAEDAAGELGAEAYTAGGAVGFAAQPSLHTAAHEAAHVVQQRGGVQLKSGLDGGSDDPFEQHADEVADAVVRGESAEPLLDKMAPGGPSATPATSTVQRKSTQLVNAFMFLHLNARDAAIEIKRHLLSISLPRPHARMEWHSIGVFREMLFWQFDRLLFKFENPSELLQLVYPSNPYAVIDQMRPIVGKQKHDADNKLRGGNVGPLDWRPSVGVAIAQLIEGALIASLGRLGPRWLAVADQTSTESAAGTSNAVDPAAVIMSHHIDRAVLPAMCRPMVFDVEPSASKQPKRKNQPASGGAVPKPAIRPVKYHWLKTRELWNFVRVTEPADATVEEVAAELFSYTAADYGEANASFLAYGITAAPPLFGLPATWAKHFEEAAEFAPAKTTEKDETAEGHLHALASSTVGDEVALQQASDVAAPTKKHKGKPDPKSTKPVDVQSLLSDAQAQIISIKGALVPWKLAGVVEPARLFLERRTAEQGEHLAKWTAALTAQKEHLSAIGGAIVELDAAATSLGMTDRNGREGEALKHVMQLYARAASVSHLDDTCAQLIVTAARAQASLSLQAVQSSVRGMDSAVDMMRDSVPAGDDQRRSYASGASQIDERAKQMQSRMMRGESVSAKEIDELTLDADIVALRSKVHAVTTQLGELERAAREGNDSIAENFAAVFSSDFRNLESATGSLRFDLQDVVRQMDQQVNFDTIAFRGTTEEYYEARHNAWRANLGKATARFDAISKRTDISNFLRKGAELVKWQSFRTSCVKIAALLGISLVAGALGGLATRFVGGLFVRAGAASTIAELSVGARMVAGGAGVATDAAIAGAGQSAIFGGSYKEAFLENALTSLGSHAVLKALAHNVDDVVKIEQATKGIWQKAGGAGKFVIREAAAISGHAIMGAALGYVAHKIVTGKSQPAPQTLEEWLLQGASIAVGRYVGKAVGAKLTDYKKLAQLPGFHPGQRLLKAGLETQKLASAIENKPTSVAAMELLARRHRLLVDEVEALEALAKRPELIKAAGLKPYQVTHMSRQAQAELAEVQTRSFSEIPLHLSGMEELVPGALWKGTAEQIQMAIGAAKRAGSQIDAVRDATTGTWHVKLNGKKLDIQERASGDPVRAPTHKQAKLTHQEAVRARTLLLARGVQLESMISAATVDGHVMKKIGHIVMGTGPAAAMDSYTLAGNPKDADPPPLADIPNMIGLGSGVDTFTKLGDVPIGQRAPELDGPGYAIKPSDLTADHDSYTSAKTPSHATVITQYRSGVPVLDAKILEVSINRDASWKVQDASVRIKVKTAAGEIFLYADRTDIATGLGARNELPSQQIAADDLTAAKYRSELETSGRMVYGDDVGGQRGGKVLVSGGSATGAWNAELARKLGKGKAEVDWIAKSVDAPGAKPRFAAPEQEFAENKAKLESGTLTPDESQRLTARQQELLAFDSAMLPRNVEPEHAAFKDSHINRHVKQIKSMTPTEHMPGKKPGKVFVEFDDGTSGTYDQVVVSHGTNAAAPSQPGPAGALTLAKGIELKPVMVDGEMVALESVDPPGAVRVMGAPIWNMNWVTGMFIVDNAAKAAFVKAITAKVLNPRDSPGKVLLHHVGKQIPAANRKTGWTD